MAEQQTIAITVRGGVIHTIQGIPANVSVVVRDYDTDGVDPERLATDENGDEYTESIWETEE